MNGANGIPPELLGGVPVQKFTPFEVNLLNRISSVTMALYAVSAQLEAVRMQLAGEGESEATVKHAKEVAGAALKMAGIRLGAKEAKP